MKIRIGRRDIFNQLAENQSIHSENLIWMHCASLGEFEQGRPIIEMIKKQFPEKRILLTFFSPSGFEIRKNYPLADCVSYLPFDSQKNAERFLEIVKPRLAIFVKYEIWYHFINQLKINQIPLYLVSANFRENQIFFQWYGNFFKKILFNFNHIFVQNSQSQKLLESIDYQNVTIAGDTRFDRVKSLTDNPQKLPIIEAFKGNQKLFVIGSAWVQDFNFLLPFLNNEKYDFKTIIAPHEINESEMINWQSQLKGKSIKYSECVNNQEFTTESVLFIDNIGLLSSIYNYAEFCWVGGGFGSGLHNILEAATYGKPIFFGNKNYTKFQEAIDLIELGSAFSVSELSDFLTIFDILYQDSKFYNSTTAISKQYVAKNIGATDIIIKSISQQL
ncbi:MAG: glycosyltransferase N-terminal domain-containing protein [Bacteroidota bacterium]